MKNSTIFAKLLVFFVSLAVLTPIPASAQIKWEKSFARAEQLAERTKKPLLIDFYAPWCGPCRQMEQETFTNATVKALMQRMVCIRLNVDQEPPQARQYSVSSIPRLIVLRPGSARPIVDLEGFHDAGDLIPELRGALGLKSNETVALAQENPALFRVRQALQGNRFAALKAADSKTANAGLNLLVKQLGAKNEAALSAPALLIRNAGDDAVPALLTGMSDPYLAVRVVSYRVLQDVIRKKNLRTPTAYDPWASAKVRHTHLSQWRQWWDTVGVTKKG